MMKTKKLSLIVLSLLTALCLSFGIITFIPKTASAAAGDNVVVTDDFNDIDTENQYYEKSNMFTNNDDKGDKTMGYLPVKAWGSKVMTTDGYMTYRIKSDSGYVFNGLNISAKVGAGHEGGLYYWQEALKANPDYRWPGGNVYTTNMYIYVSADNQNWTPAVYTLIKDGKVNNGDGIQEQKETNIYDISVELDEGQFPSSNELYVKFFFEHPENSELPISTYDDGTPYTQVGLMFASVTITGEQGAVPSTLTVSDNFNDRTEAKDFIENVNMISEGNLGHGTFGFVPSTEGWNGNVTLPATAYLTYRLSATKGCYITSLDLDAYVTLCHWGNSNDWSNATIKVMASYDNVSYFELYDLRADKTIEDEWIDGKSYYGAKGDGCLNGAGYLEGSLAGMSGTPDSSSFAGLGCDVRYRIEKTYDNATLTKKTDTIYIRLVCSNYAGETKSLAQCPTRLHNVEFTINQAALEGISIDDDMTTDTTKHVFAVDNVVSSGYSLTMYNDTYGWVPASEWNDPATGVGTGSVTYVVNADAGALLDNLLFSMDYRMFSLDETKHAGGNVDIIVKVSNNGVDYVPVWSAFEKNGIDTSNDPKTLTDLDLSKYAKNLNSLFIQIEMVCPTEETQNLGNIPVTLRGVKIDATQKMMGVNSAVNYVFGTEAADRTPQGVVDYSNVVVGNNTFGLIPTAEWDGTVNVETGYLTYKLSAGEGKKLGNLFAIINAEVMDGGNIIISTSKDGTSFTEVFNLVEIKNAESTCEKNIAYSGPYTWTAGAEGQQRNYQRIAASLSNIQNYSEAYVRITLDVTSNSVVLWAVPVKIFSIDLLAEVTDRLANAAYITYETYGGVNNSENPEYYMVGDTVELKEPTYNGMTFLGWYLSDDYSGDPVTTLDTTTLKDYVLYAKWDSHLVVTLDLVNAGDLVTINEQTAESKGYDFELRDKVSLTFGTSNAKYLYSVLVNGEEVAISGNAYTISSLRSATTIKVIYQDRGEIVNSFSINYEQFKEGENGWMIGSYDFDNLKMTEFDGTYGLGPKATAKEGYITYKIVAPTGKYFNAVLMEVLGKLSNFGGTGTRDDNNYVDAYLGFVDPVVNGYDTFTLFKQFEIGSGNGAYKTNTQLRFTTELEGKSEFYVQFRIKSASGANWILLRNFNVDASEYKFNQVTVNFVDDAGASIAPLYIYNQYTGLVFDTANVVIPNGYALKEFKFYTDASCETEYDLTQKVESDLVLYVKVLAASGNIWYVLNGGTNSADNPFYYVSTSAITLSDPTREDFTFAGWYFDEDFDTLFTGIAQGRTGDITVYAKWVSNQLPSIEAYANITYVLNDGTNNASNPAMYFYGETTALYNPTYSGKAFLGWYLTSDFSGSAITEISASATGDITLYAKWGETTATITYVLNGGVNASANPATYNIGETTMINAATRAHYDFLGWYLNEDFSGDAITEIAATQNGNITLYAKWSTRYITITYVLDGGENATENIAKVENGTMFNLANPTKAGFEFMGWKDANDNYITQIVSDAEAEDLTLTAVWKEVETDEGGCGSRVNFMDGALIGAMVVACGAVLVVARKKKAK